MQTADSSPAFGALRNDKDSWSPWHAPLCGPVCLGFDRNESGKTRTGVSAPHEPCQPYRLDAAHETAQCPSYSMLVTVLRGESRLCE
jgi:hypothetical protein